MRICGDFQRHETQLLDELQIAGKGRRFSDDDVAGLGHSPQTELDTIQTPVGDHQLTGLHLPPHMHHAGSNVTAQHLFSLRMPIPQAVAGEIALAYTAGRSGELPQRQQFAGRQGGTKGQYRRIVEHREDRFSQGADRHLARSLQAMTTSPRQGQHPFPSTDKKTRLVPRLDQAPCLQLGIGLCHGGDAVTGTLV